MRFLAFIAILLAYSTITAQEKEIDLYSLSLEDLINIEVSISTKTKVGLRETPGIVTIITKEEIKRSGARDIIELFHLFVPGFDFGVDVEGVVGMGIRGIWAHEGKYLFMVNGFTMNDGMFACVPFGNHFALDNVEKIEIIRGPGSAIYGGFAGLGVVNIITRDTYEYGGKVTYTATHTGKQFSHNQLSVGHTIHDNDLLINISATYGAGSRSDRAYTDYYRNSRNLLKASDTYTKQLALKLDYKGFTIQTFLDDYLYYQIDLWDELYRGTPVHESFKSNFVDLSYKFQRANFNVIPHITYEWQKPWQVNIPEINYSNNKIFQSLTPGISAYYNKKALQVVSGVELKTDRLRLPSMVDTLYEETFKNGKDLLSYTNFSAYSQLLWNSKYVNLNIGARYDYSSEFGDALTPRIGLTKLFKRYHIKLMGSKSFRTPGGILPNRIPNDYPKLYPESGITFEFENGFLISNNSMLTLNLYDITFEDIIIYGKDAQSGVGYYKNQGKIGTRGVEMGFKMNTSKVLSTINLAYYSRKNSDSDSLFMVPNKTNQYLALSPLRINGLISYKISNITSFSVTASYFGERYSYNYIANNNDILVKQKTNLLVGINMIVSDFPFKNFETQLIATNLLGSDFYYLQPYKGAHGPLPGLDRSFGFRVIYEY
ncbi:MAG: TonB-dependent receptor plug domain-containing protein [Tenuifilum sp.]|uniref:TonB-dependent receptor plug domain-containing protein n=1 Tax=Tenuifilum sp. TaxID=2760880 RepID=UPI0030953177